MSGEWIKMRADLHECPEVIGICKLSGLDTYAVIGRLHRLWSWADQHTDSGRIPHVTPEWIDGLTEWKNFANLLVKVGWLRVTQNGISILGFDKHMSQSAKARALATERQRRKRVTPTSRSKRDASVTREEKRVRAPAGARAHPTPPPSPTPQDGNGEEPPDGFAVVVEDWEKASGKTLSSMLQDQIRESVQLVGVDRTRKAIALAAKAGANSWAYVEGILRRGGDLAASGNGVATFPPGHPAHGRKRGEEWESDGVVYELRRDGTLWQKDETAPMGWRKKD